MPEITVLHIGIATVCVIAGVLAGWSLRGNRCAQEKSAVNAGWQEQLEAKSTESTRLQDQNKSLMEQVSQYQASGKDATNRARELSSALKEAFERRDELQRQIKDIRSNLEAVIAERRKLESDVRQLSSDDSSMVAALAAKDDKIARLGRELENWQNRLPPLIDKFRERNTAAERLETQLAEAHEQIRSLEMTLSAGETRVEPMDRDTLADAFEASNDADEDPEAAAWEAAVAELDTAADLDADADDEASTDSDPGSESGPDGDDDSDDSDDSDGFVDNLPAGNDAIDTADGHAPEQEADRDDAAAGRDPDDQPPADEPWLERDRFAESAADESANDDAQPRDQAGDDPVADAPDSTSGLAASDPVLPDFDGSGEPGGGASEQAADQASTGGLRDNLKKIKGIGPAIEKTLNELGIFRYSQLAEMTEYDIDRIARRLRGFRSRIYREDWIGQARDLKDRRAGAGA